VPINLPLRGVGASRHVKEGGNGRTDEEEEGEGALLSFGPTRPWSTCSEYKVLYDMLYSTVQ
jgi:hypothetical protein